MDQAIKDQWVLDLESGNFRKGTGRLHKVRATYDYTKPVSETEPYTRTVRHEFCCLGVLCEQAVAAGVAERTLIGDDEGGYYMYHRPGASPHETGSDAYLPHVVREWAGLTDVSPALDATGVIDTGCDVEGCDCNRTATLAQLNDEHFEEFAPIANLIKERLDV